MSDPVQPRHEAGARNLSPALLWGVIVFNNGDVMVCFKAVSREEPVRAAIMVFDTPRAVSGPIPGSNLVLALRYGDGSTVYHVLAEAKSKLVEPIVLAPTVMVSETEGKEQKFLYEADVYTRH